MKRQLIDDAEKNQILEMHKTSMIEQANLPEKNESPELSLLRKAISAGCLKQGRILTNSNRSQYVYRATTKSGKEVDFFANMSYKFRDGSKTGKWACPQLANIAAEEEKARQEASINKSKIETELKKGWKTLDTLRSEGVDLTTLDNVYEKKVIGNVTLYRPRGSSTTFTPGTSTSDFNANQESFINKFIAKGYVLNPTRIQQSTMVKVTDKELGAPEDLFPNGLVMWYDPNKQSDIRRREGSVLGDILDNQSINRNVCRKNIKDYYESFKRRNSIVIDPATINKAKRIVQACKDQHYGKWGIGGQGKKLDEYLDILSGNKEGGPTSYGSDSSWRIK